MKIKVYYNKKYLFTTTRYNNVKQLKSYMQEGKTIRIASVPQDITHVIDNIKTYAFEIVK